MALIDFYIRNQKLSKTAPTLVADSINYVNCSFTFKTDDWNGFDKWVVFSKGAENYRVNLIDDAIPKEAGLNLGEGLWNVSVFGENPEETERITTNSVTVEVAKSTIQNGEPLPPISLTEAEQISAKAQLALNAANEVLAKAESGEFNGAPGKDGENATPEQIAEAVEDYFEENPIPGGSAEVTTESIKTALGYVPANEADIPEVPVESVFGRTGNVKAQSGDYTAEMVGAEKAGTAASAVGAHNIDESSHNDIRLALSELKAAVEAFLDMDDSTYDKLSELVQKIEANAGSIAQLTNGKINVSDIINNLTTNAVNKPLSAAQGVVLKGLVDNLNTVASGAKTTAENAAAKAQTASDNVAEMQERMDSGEFKGDKGDPYTLTETDKNSIAQAVYAMVADGNEVAY